MVTQVTCNTGVLSIIFQCARWLPIVVSCYHGNLKELTEKIETSVKEGG